MTELNARIRDIALPFNMQALPIDDRGFPVPWFVGWRKDTGKPDFRVIKPYGRETALKRGVCWVCGKPLGRLKCTPVGPMCVVNKVTSEPPSHLECARYAVRACPFLANPRMVRNEKGLPKDMLETPGQAIDRNPGVAAIWISLHRSKPFPDGRGNYLFDLGPVDRVEWYAHGRDATRDEVIESITSGLPALLEVAVKEGNEAVIELQRYAIAAAKLLPPEPEVVA